MQIKSFSVWWTKKLLDLVQGFKAEIKLHVIVPKFKFSYNVLNIEFF